MGQDNGETSEGPARAIDPEQLGGADNGNANFTGSDGTGNSGSIFGDSTIIEDTGPGTGFIASSAADPSAPYGRKPDGTAYKRKHGPRNGNSARTGTGAQSGTRRASASLKGFGDLLVFFHATLSAVTKIPELSLDPAEGKEIEKAAEAVAKHYPIGEVFNEKTNDWIKLSAVLGQVYGTRYLAYRTRLRTEFGGATADAGSQDKNSVVRPFPGGGGTVVR